MHDDQVHIDADIARQLIDDSFPQYRSEPIEHVDSQGTVNAIYRVGSVAAARFPLRAADPHALEAALQRESAGMIEFASACPFPSPRPIGLGRPGGRTGRRGRCRHGWRGMSATPTGLAASATFAADLAALIESLRAADTRGRTFNGQGRGGRIADQEEWMETSFRQSTELLDVAQLRSIWVRLRQLPPAGYDTMSHKDLIPANILVRGERIVGILDAGDFGPGGSCAGPRRPLAPARRRRTRIRAFEARTGTRRVDAWSGVGIRAGDGSRLVLRAHQPGHERTRSQHPPAIAR